MFPDELSAGIPHVVNLTKDTSLGDLIAAGNSIRAAIDRVTQQPAYREGLRGPALDATRTSAQATDKARTANAQSIRERITGLLS